MSTYDEIKTRSNEPGKFLLMPGVEITQLFNGLHLHVNYVNLPLLLPCMEGAGLIQRLPDDATMPATLAMNARHAEQAAQRLGLPHLLMVNHPFYAWCDIVPQDLIDCPQVRFFEVCNNGTNLPPHPDLPGYTPDQFWDAVNAFRRIRGRGQPLLYGVGSDDAHFYDPQRIGGRSGVGNAWIVVRADRLTPEHLLAAMHRGAFYATTGVVLDDVTFNPDQRSLRVKVNPEPGVRYRIHFISTKRDFDQTVGTLFCPAEQERPTRRLPIYAEDIGRIVKTVEGVEATCHLADDDLYLRARIESDQPGRLLDCHFHPPVRTAWTQPYAPDDGTA